MEFNKKLQNLRKQKGITQENLAEALYVSRTAISKWESGRGYPNIESLKAISNFFDITVDELISGEELLSIAEESTKQKQNNICDLIFGLLDVSVAMFMFLPIFGQKTANIVTQVSVLSLTEISLYLKIIYLTVIAAIIIWGVLTLALQNCNCKIWVNIKRKISLVLNIVGVTLFTISPQPYASIFLLTYLIIKASLIIKKQ
jgi:transcriptional regulator with XRE-family HTH domain